MPRRHHHHYYKELYEASQNAYRSRQKSQPGNLAQELGTAAEMLQNLPDYLTYGYDAKQAIKDILDPLEQSTVISPILKRTLKALYLLYRDDKRKQGLYRYALPAPTLAHVIGVMATSARVYQDKLSPEMFETVMVLSGMHDSLEDGKNFREVRRHVINIYSGDVKKGEAMMKLIMKISDDSPPALDRVMRSELSHCDEKTIQNLLVAVKKSLKNIDQKFISPSLGQPSYEDADLELITPFVKKFSQSLSYRFHDASSDMLSNIILRAFLHLDPRSRLFRIDQKILYARTFREAPIPVVLVKLSDLHRNVRYKLLERDNLPVEKKNPQAAADNLKYCKTLFEICKARNLQGTDLVISEIAGMLPPKPCRSDPSLIHPTYERFYGGRCRIPHRRHR